VNTNIYIHNRRQAHVISNKWNELGVKIEVTKCSITTNGQRW